MGKIIESKGIVDANGESVKDQQQEAPPSRGYVLVGAVLEAARQGNRYHAARCAFGDMIDHVFAIMEEDTDNPIKNWHGERAVEYLVSACDRTIAAMASNREVAKPGMPEKPASGLKAE